MLVKDPGFDSQNRKYDEVAGFMAACNRRQKEIVQSLCGLPGVDVQKLGEGAYKHQKKVFLVSVVKKLRTNK